MSHIAVFLRSENPAVASPRHSSSLTLALQVLAASSARWISDKRDAIQLVTSESWKAVKARVRKSVLDGNNAPLLPPLPYYNTVTAYPPNGQETNAKELQKQVWLRATRF